MSLVFLPQPHQMTVKPGKFRIPAKGAIGICCHKLYPAAQAIREIFEGLPIGVSVAGVEDTVSLKLVDGLQRGGYRLAITPEGVRIEGDSPAAVADAICTLAQAAQQSSPQSLPLLEIVDWPDFQDRGVYYDVCRGRVPKLKSLLEQVEELARFKINHYQLYIEHTFSFRGHPDIGVDASPLSAGDILALDARCRELGIEMVPSLASFGHLATVLRHPRYRELAEDWGIGKYVAPGAQANPHLIGWSLSPANPKIYDFLDSLFAEFLPLFSSDRFNVCCDETWDLGAGQSYELCQKLGKGRVYLNHILKLRELAAKYGKKIMFWGDIIRHHPELITEIPKDVTVLDWGYSFNHPFDKISDFKAAGLEFFACPGTSSWVTLMPRLHEAAANIAGFAAAGKAHGARGLLNTDWGDGGHYNFMELSWHGYLMGAEQAWNSGADTSDFTYRFCKLFLGVDSKPLARAISDLGDIAHLQFSRYYQSIWRHVFFAPVGDGLLAGPEDMAFVREGGQIVHKKITLDAALGAKTLKRIEGVRAALLAADKEQADPLMVLPYWIFAADTIAHAARKLSVLGKGGSDSPAARTALRKEMMSLRKRFRNLWMARNQSSEIRVTLDLYNKAIDSL